MALCLLAVAAVTISGLTSTWFGNGMGENLGTAQNVIAAVRIHMLKNRILEGTRGSVLSMLSGEESGRSSKEVLIDFAHASKDYATTVAEMADLKLTPELQSGTGIQLTKEELATVWPAKTPTKLASRSIQKIWTGFSGSPWQ